MAKLTLDLHRHGCTCMRYIPAQTHIYHIRSYMNIHTKFYLLVTTSKQNTKKKRKGQTEEGVDRWLQKLLPPGCVTARGSRAPPPLSALGRWLKRPLWSNSRFQFFAVIGFSWQTLKWVGLSPRRVWGSR